MNASKLGGAFVVSFMSLVALLAACSGTKSSPGGGGGSAHVEGGVAGITFGPTIREQTALEGTVTINNATYGVVGFELSDLASVSPYAVSFCTSAQRGSFGTQAFSASLACIIAPGTSGQVVPGNYAVTEHQDKSNGAAFPFVGCGIAKPDAQCNEPSASQGAYDLTGGSITLTSVTSSMVAGTFSISFGGGTVSGDFNAPVCSGVDLLQLVGPNTSGNSTPQNAPSNGECPFNRGSSNNNQGSGSDGGSTVAGFQTCPAGTWSQTITNRTCNGPVGTETLTISASGNVLTATEVDQNVQDGPSCGQTLSGIQVAYVGNGLTLDAPFQDSGCTKRAVSHFIVNADCSAMTTDGNVGLENCGTCSATGGCSGCGTTTCTQNYGASTLYRH